MVLPKITMSMEEATEIIKAQLKRGREISDMEDAFFSDINDAISEERIWSDFNRSFAEKAFGEKHAKDYEGCVPHPRPFGGTRGLRQRGGSFPSIESKDSLA